MYSNPHAENRRQRLRWLENIAAVTEVHLKYIDEKVKARAYNRGLFHGACYGIGVGVALAWLIGVL